ncbi:DUF412 family protein [Cellvibrio mixtus]|uniref:DUF412 family protein n=1 Tax=Cellvibrio mixtus TaxID=39650 RepID=UPI003CC81330
MHKQFIQKALTIYPAFCFYLFCNAHFLSRDNRTHIKTKAAIAAFVHSVPMQCFYWLGEIYFSTRLELAGCHGSGT